MHAMIDNERTCMINGDFKEQWLQGRTDCVLAHETMGDMAWNMAWSWACLRHVLESHDP